MKKIYTLFGQRPFLFFLSLVLLSVPAMSQVCGPSAQSFNSSPAGFTGDFTYENQKLVKHNVIGTAIYSVTSPTYQLSASATSLGYGFTLDGTEQVSRVEVVVVYISTLNNQPTTIFLGQFVPNYGANSFATVCRAVDLTDLPGFPTSGPNAGKYRYRIDLSSSTGNGQAAQTISFDDFRTNGTEAAPLPVVFIGFEARKSTGGTQLTWKIAGEENVNHYEVERSSDGRNFTSVYSILAIKKDNYTYLDPSAGSTAYYRIKDVDNDGHFKYSNIARIVNGQLSIVIRAFPQPVINQLTVQHSTISSTTGLLTISSADGRIVSVVRPTPGSMQTYVDMTKLQKGLYVVRFDDGNGATETMKVVKQ